jgi:hypothetical protein
LKLLYIYILFTTSFLQLKAQQITGYWHGNIGGGIGTKHELKIVLKGDSLVGTSYYYSSKTKYQKYSIKGYFDARTNAVIWWDDQLLESKTGKIGILPQRELELLTEADFNCPGSGKMKLEGKAKNKLKRNNEIKVDLTKVENPVFDDAWNEVIDNWQVGGSNPNFINDVLAYELGKKTTETIVPLDNEKAIVYTETKTNNETVTETTVPVKKAEQPIVNNEPPLQKQNETTSKPIADTKPTTPTVVQTEKKPPIEFLDVSKRNNSNKPVDIKPIDSNKLINDVVVKNEAPIEKPIEIAKTEPVKKEPIEFLTPKKKEEIPTPQVPIAKQPIEPKSDEVILKEKLNERNKVVLAELPIADSIKFSFFDNAEVDGDSISLFLNTDLLFKHIRLSDRAFEFTLYKDQINKGDVSITMVAENLGTIPPNTSYMKAIINGKKYEAYLSSTENTSAVIRFRNQE